jgi:hypothetical protein
MENIERKVLELIATDRIDIPLSSMENKLKKARARIGKDAAADIVVGYEGNFVGERAYARVETEDLDKARGMKVAVEEFCTEFPKYGEILQGKIAEKRVVSETHLYFGTNPECRLTADDYMDVMASIGITPAVARNLYPTLMDVSRKLSRARNEERSVLVNGTLA